MYYPAFGLEAPIELHERFPSTWLEEKSSDDNEIEEEKFSGEFDSSNSKSFSNMVEFEKIEGNLSRCQSLTIRRSSLEKCRSENDFLDRKIFESGRNRWKSADEINSLKICQVDDDSADVGLLQGANVCEPFFEKANSISVHSDLGSLQSFEEDPSNFSETERNFLDLINFQPHSLSPIQSSAEILNEGNSQSDETIATDQTFIKKNELNDSEFIPNDSSFQIFFDEQNLSQTKNKTKMLNQTFTSVLHTDGLEQIQEDFHFQRQADSFQVPTIGSNPQFFEEVCTHF